MDAVSAIQAAVATPGVAPTGKGRGLSAKDAERVAKDFESVLVTKLVEEMARTVEADPLSEDSAAGQVNDLFYYHLAQDISAKGGIGLWKQIARQIGAPGEGGAPAGQEVVK